MRSTKERSLFLCVFAYIYVTCSSYHQLRCNQGYGRSLERFLHDRNVHFNSNFYQKRQSLGMLDHLLSSSNSFDSKGLDKIDASMVTKKSLERHGSMFSYVLTSIATLVLLSFEYYPKLANAAVYTASDRVYSFTYPDSFQSSPKPVRTHEEEVLFTSKDLKGYSIGLTIDRVKLGNIKDFTTPEGLAKKVEAVERGKEGVFDVQILKYEEIPLTLQDLKDEKKKNTATTTTTSSESQIAEVIPEYVLEYVVDSSRGKNHFEVASTIYNKKLFVLTAQYKDADAASVHDEASTIVKSLQLS